MAVLPIAIIAGAAVAGAAASYEQARKQNNQIKDANKNVVSASQANDTNTDIATTDQTKRVARQFALYQGAATASAGARGVGGSRSEAALEQSALNQALTDQTTVTQNADASKIASHAGAISSINSNSSGYKNPAMSGVQGGLGGLSSGLSLIGSYNQAYPTPAK